MISYEIFWHLGNGLKATPMRSHRRWGRSTSGRPLRAQGQPREVLCFCSEEFVSQLFRDVQAPLCLLATGTARHRDETEEPTYGSLWKPMETYRNIPSNKRLGSKRDVPRISSWVRDLLAQSVWNIIIWASTVSSIHIYPIHRSIFFRQQMLVQQARGRTGSVL